MEKASKRRYLCMYMYSRTHPINNNNYFLGTGFNKINMQPLKKVLTPFSLYIIVTAANTPLYTCGNDDDKFPE